MSDNAWFVLWFSGYWVSTFVWYKVDTSKKYWTKYGFLNTILSLVIWPLTLPVALYRLHKITRKLREVDDFLKETAKHD